jgi:hypothetical protein
VEGVVVNIHHQLKVLWVLQEQLILVEAVELLVVDLIHQIKQMEEQVDPV